MSELLGIKFFVGPRMTPGKGNGRSNSPKFASNKIQFMKIYGFSFTMYTKKMFTIEMGDGQKCPKPSIIYS